MYRIRMIDYVAPDGKGSRIGVLGETFRVSDRKSEEVMEELLYEEGTSLEGAVNCGKHYLGNVYKVPVRMAVSRCTFFPVFGKSRGDCIWICNEKIAKVRKNSGLSEVEFFDGLKIELPITPRAVHSRMRLCRRYSYLADTSSCLSKLLNEENKE